MVVLSRKKQRINNSVITVLICLTCGLLVGVLSVLLLYLKGYVPFGDKSLAYEDAYYQYMDFFAYLKDALNGENNIFYSFSNGLGKSSIGLFAYYLASPLNLLVVLFEKNQMNLFLDILIVIKVSISAVTMSFFLINRFNGRLKTLFVILLAISYAMMQYSWAQCSNVMWLDGVCLLPLLLLAVHYLVYRGNYFYLTFMVGISILIQWYTAGINCLYCIIIFGTELAFISVERGIFDLLWYIKKVLLYGVSMIGGICLSACLFLPTILDLRSGKGEVDWEIFNKAFRGNILTAITNYKIGGVSSFTEVCLYCGSVVLIGCIAFFMNSEGEKKRKAVLAGLVSISLLIIYWQPFFALFSLLKNVKSYWYRYSYVSIFGLIYVAAFFYKDYYMSENRGLLLRSSLLFCFVILLTDIIKGENDQLTYWTSVIVVVTALVLTATTSRLRLVKKIGGAILAFVLCTELLLNASKLNDKYHLDDAKFYDDYVVSLNAQIEGIKLENEFFRITQCSSKEMQHRGLNINATYDNAMSCNYAGIASYTSCPDQEILDFLERAGYRSQSESMSIINTSILPIDSLLNVKYALLPHNISGYSLIKDPDSLTELAVYENLYQMPVAFTYHGDNGMMGEYINPFEYVNDLYSVLAGRKATVFMKEKFETVEQNGAVVYKISRNDDGPLYGNIPWSNYQQNFSIDVNGCYTQGYSRRLAPSVFDIPETDQETSVTYYCSNKPENPQFYRTDLNELKRLSELFWSRSANVERFENGLIKMSVFAENGDDLFVSVPWNRGWEIRVNGHVVSAGKIENALMSIPLSEGENMIEMKYFIPGLRIGIVISLVTFIIWILLFIRFIRNCRKHRLVYPDDKIMLCGNGETEEIKSN